MWLPVTLAITSLHNMYQDEPVENIQIPYNFNPRPYQFELLRALDSGYTRAIAVWSRRAGKDKTLLNLVVKKALERVGVYYYFFPTYTQGRKVIWDGIDNAGFKFLDHIPKELIASRNATEMKITLTNGSLIQIVGTDDVDKVRGTNPVGCVFSEFAWQNPMAWDIVRPILRANGGWAVFNSTPFGENHFHTLWTRALDNPEWFTQMVTVETALDNDGQQYITDEDIAEELASGMSEDLIEQEFFCSFRANTGGFYYRKQLTEAKDMNRICNVPYDEAVLVDTWWDLGIGDQTSIWFTQTVGKEIHVIDYYANSGEGLQHYARELQNKKYVYGVHHLPHDANARELGTGRSRFEVMEELLGHNIEVVPRLAVDDGIQAGRLIFTHCWFDETKCAKGLEALANYHREWDDKNKVFKNTPSHDWSSHAADAFRYFAVGYTIPRRQRSRKDDYLRRMKGFRTKSWMAT